jgi:hypothetical protein
VPLHEFPVAQVRLPPVPQQGCPAPPHATHIAPASVDVEQVAPLAVQLLFEQHSLPMLPQMPASLTQPPAEHIPFAPPQLTPGATH